MDENEDTTYSLQPCSMCSRTFRPDALERHEGICKKSTMKKRKIFDSSKQRVDGTEIKATPPSESNKKEKPKKKSNWREKHQELIKNIRNAKGEPNEINDSPKKTVPSDYIQCPNCFRHFNQKAADRHISWCQSQKTSTPKRSVSKEAQDRLQARTKYKAPLPGKKGTDKTLAKSASREKTKINLKHVPIENEDKKKLGIAESVQNHSKSGKQNERRTAHEHDTIRSRESIINQNINNGTQQVVKFKEKFPNRSTKRFPELEDNYSSLGHMSSHLRDILNNKGADNRSPRTVPGVRTGGLDISGTLAQSPTAENTNEDEYGILQRLVDLNSSISSTASVYGDMNNSWNKKLFLSNNSLPEVSSCDGPSQGWPSRSCWGSNSNTPLSSSSSISSLSTSTSGSRGGSSEGVMPLFCSHCGSKYPVTAAKYCCECGAKRRGFGTSSYKTELISY